MRRENRVATVADLAAPPASKVAAPWQAVLSRSGLLSSPHLWSGAGGCLVHHKDDRRTYRLQLAGEPVFWKVYSIGSMASAAREWAAVTWLHDHAFPCPEPIALIIGPGTAGVLQKGLPGSQADALLGRRDGPPAVIRSTAVRLRRLQALGEVAGRLHRLGWVHMDLYPCHFLVPPERETSVGLIDLHRAHRPGRLAGWRWQCKDLGALIFGAWECALSTPELQAMLAAYWSQCPPRGRIRVLVEGAARIEAGMVRRRQSRSARK